MTTSLHATLDTGTRLALDRTRLAYERTMMAWIRTAASLISFGFTIYKFFQLEGNATQEHVLGPRGFAIIMIGTGLVALGLSAVQHRKSLLLLKEAYGPLPQSVAGPVAALVAVLGALALIGVVVRV